MNGSSDGYRARGQWLHGPSPIPRAALLSVPPSAGKFADDARRPGHAETGHIGQPGNPSSGGLVSPFPVLRYRTLGVLNEIRRLIRSL
jgi:hypothetical protein